jgi:hypothetical protein
LPTDANGGIANTDSAIKASNYLELSAAVKLADRITFGVGVKNPFAESSMFMAFSVRRLSGCRIPLA